jgi:hypothetical protein
VILILLWGFVIAAVVAVRHDIFGIKAPKPTTAPARPPVAKPAPLPKPPRRQRRIAATKLVVIDGDSSGASVGLSSLPVTIGRAASSTIVLADDFVSNHHARLVPRGPDWLIEDVGSTNGTFVDETKVTEPVVVAAGNRIKIGRNVLELQ